MRDSRAAKTVGLIVARICSDVGKELRVGRWNRDRSVDFHIVSVLKFPQSIGIKGAFVLLHGRILRKVLFPFIPTLLNVTYPSLFRSILI